jgi:hypothetical protein
MTTGSGVDSISRSFFKILKNLTLKISYRQEQGEENLSITILCTHKLHGIVSSKNASISDVHVYAISSFVTLFKAEHLKITEMFRDHSYHRERPVGADWNNRWEETLTINVPVVYSVWGGTYGFGWGKSK